MGGLRSVAVQLCCEVCDVCKYRTARTMFDANSDREGCMRYWTCNLCVCVCIMGDRKGREREMKRVMEKHERKE